MSNPLSPSIPPQDPAPTSSSSEAPQAAPSQPFNDASDPLVDDGFTSVTWEQHQQPEDTSASSSDPPPFQPFSSDPISPYQHPNPRDSLEAAAGGGGFQNVAGGGPEHFNDADPVPIGVDAAERRAHGEMREATREAESSLPSWEGKWVDVKVQDPQKEHEGSKDAHVTYAVVVRTNVQGYVSSDPASSTGKNALRPTADLPTTVRRRFQDFAFLQQNLTRLFPACVVPPIPDKHRLEYLRGDRFSAEFVEHRRQELQHFLTRVARHPTLARSMLARDFLLSSQWNVAMHRHSAGVVTGAPGTAAQPGSVVPPMEKSGLIDKATDTFINAFARVRKPDERFLDLLSGLEKFEDNVGGIERLVAKDQKRSEDMAQDYVDLAAAWQGLGYLESGITEPLNRFAERMLDFSSHLKEVDTTSVEPLLSHLHSLSQYSQSHRSVIKLRDQKQLDFEELSAYLSAVVSERDRLAALNTGHSNAPVGLTTYLRDQVDRIRGTDDVHTRRERMRKLDGKIKELQDAVTSAHETSTEFSDEVLKEHNVFELSKQEEMKEMWRNYARGQIEMYKQTIEDWDSIVPILKRIKVEV